MKMMTFSFFVVVLLSYVGAFAAEADKVQCDDEFVDEYLTKRDCIVYMSADACTKISLSKRMAGEATAGVIRGSTMGLVADRIFNKWVNLDPNTKEMKEKYRTAMKETLKLEKDIRSFKKMADKVYSDNTKKLKKGSTASSFEIMQGKLAGMAELIDEASKKDLKAKAERVSDPQLRELYMRLAEKPRTEHYNKIAQREYERIIAKNFPEQYNKLKPIYDQMETKNREKFKQLQKQLDEMIRKDPKLKLVNNLGQLEPVNLDNEKKFKGAWDFIKDYVSESKLSRAAGAKPVSGKTVAAGGLLGAIGGAAIPVGIDSWYNVKDKKFVEGCRNNLKLSDKEIELFKGEHGFFSGSKLIPDNTKECKNLSFVNPEETIKLVRDNFNEIPEGTCNVIKSESNRLDAIFGTDDMDVTVTCDTFKAKNTKVIGDDPQAFWYSDGDFVVKAPSDSKEGWPNFANAKVFEVGCDMDSPETCKVDQFKTAALQMKFPEETPEEAITGRNPRRDIEVYSKICTNDNPDKKVSFGGITSTSGSRECQLFRSAMSARLKTAIVRRSCEEEEKNASRESSGAKGEKASQ